MDINNRIWLIRTAGELNENKVYCDFEPLEDLSIVKDDIFSILKNRKPGIQKARLDVNTEVAEDFFKKIKIGDFAIVTSRIDKNQISIVKIEGDYYFNAQQKKHVREIHPLLQMNRIDLSESFRRALRIPRVVASLTLTPEILEFANKVKKTDADNNTVKAVFPLRTDFSITINIPNDMKKAEAERLSDFVRSLWLVE